MTLVYVHLTDGTVFSPFSSSAFFSFFLSCSWTAEMSHRITWPLCMPPATSVGLSGLNLNVMTSNGASRTNCGLIGSMKFHTKMALVFTLPLCSTRSSKVHGSVHDTATTPLVLVSQSTALTFFPLLYVRSVKDWYSVMTLSLLCPGAESSSASDANSSSKMSKHSFCCSANSETSVILSKNSFISALAHAAFASPALASRGSYCVEPVLSAACVACTATSFFGATVCTPTSCSSRFNSKFGSLNGRHSICDEFHSSCESLSLNLKEAPNSRRLRVMLIAIKSRVGFTSASSISTSDPSETHSAGSRRTRFFFFAGPAPAASATSAAAAAAAAASAARVVGGAVPTIAPFATRATLAARFIARTLLRAVRRRCRRCLMRFLRRIVLILVASILVSTAASTPFTPVPVAIPPSASGGRFNRVNSGHRLRLSRRQHRRRLLHLSARSQKCGAIASHPSANKRWLHSRCSGGGDSRRDAWRHERDIEPHERPAKHLRILPHLRSGSQVCARRPIWRVLLPCRNVMMVHEELGGHRSSGGRGSGRNNHLALVRGAPRRGQNVHRRSWSRMQRRRHFAGTCCLLRRGPRVLRSRRLILGKGISWGHSLICCRRGWRSRSQLLGSLILERDWRLRRAGVRIGSSRLWRVVFAARNASFNLLELFSCAAFPFLILSYLSLSRLLCCSAATLELADRLDLL
mmetsp:Transcript_1293/g.4795  ORF Transcript_1293/g.4795 Transcript_1293/m.4795 type:complete len:693 (+) Transcript_1293:906-2984(+)